MKNIYKYFLGFFLLAITISEAAAQIPTYNLRAMNLKYYGCPANILEFDVYIEHTNPPTVFSYYAGQYFFDFNPDIANGGTLTYQIVGSDLPSNQLPRSPSIVGSTLRLLFSLPPGIGNGFIMTNNGYPGTKIVRMRLTTLAESFANVPLNLQWRNEAQGNPFTKVWAYIGAGNVEITTGETHSIEGSSTLTCEKFLLNNPPYNSPVNPLPVTCSWYRAQEAIDYKVQVSTVPNFSDIVFNDSNITDTFKIVSGLAINSKYYWKVYARNNTGYYLTSPVWYFTTGLVNNGQIPTYNLTVRNFQLNNPGDNQLEFDIYMEHTNPPATFEYAQGQYYFNFNPLIANGGTLTFTILGSDLPLNLRPQSASVSINQLRLTSNNPPGAGFGFIMTNNGFPGTKIVKVRLATSAPQFAEVPLNLEWRNSSHGGFYTKIFAYVGPNNMNVTTDITTASTHAIDSGIVLPVELTQFIANVNKNNVILQWETLTETNNSGFEIERISVEGEWSKMGFVEGSGNSSSRKSYTFMDRNLNFGSYNYRLKQIDYNGNFNYYNLLNEINVGAPSIYDLSQNYPNPFNPNTKINFELPTNGKVSVVIYDISGKEVSTLVNEFKEAGYYTIQFNGSNVSSGMYFYKLSADNFKMTKRMVLLK